MNLEPLSLKVLATHPLDIGNRAVRIDHKSMDSMGVSAGDTCTPEEEFALWMNRQLKQKLDFHLKLSDVPQEKVGGFRLNPEDLEIKHLKDLRWEIDIIRGIAKQIFNAS